MKIKFYYKLIFILFVLNCISVNYCSASRYIALSHYCSFLRNAISGLIQIYDMDHKKTIYEKYKNIALLITPELIKEIAYTKRSYLNYLRIYKIVEQNKCKLYLVTADNDYLIICAQHGCGRIKADSPYEQFVEFCKKHNVNPSHYKIKLNERFKSDIKGSEIVKVLANNWKWLCVISLFIIFYVIRANRNTSIWVKLYLIGHTFIAFLMILSFFNIYYVGDFLPEYRRFTYGSYPNGLQSLSLTLLLALPIWWLISLVWLFILKKNNCSINSVILYILCLPASIIGEMPPLIFFGGFFINFLIPVTGIIIIYKNFFVCCKKK